jgi:site-specific recombinase XerD
MGASRSAGQVVRGPLAPFEAEFRVDLARVGYTSRSVRDLVYGMAGVSRWLEQRACAVSGLSPEVVAELRGQVSGVGPVLRFLGDAGVFGGSAAVGPVEVLVAEFRTWLGAQRGLSAVTVSCYGKQARVFLALLPEPLEVSLARLDAGQVTSFMLDYCRDRNTWSAKAMVTAMRALLRFLHVAGRVPVLLAGAVPSVAGWRLASLPRGLAAGQVELLLQSCDRPTIVGRRDYAILVLLARLGLRSAEVAAVAMGDIDWRSGEVTIRGKGNRIERLPLPVDVGEALANYVSAGRPRRDWTAVFLTTRAPYRRLSIAGVRAVVGYSCRRAGMPRVGAHRLRHTLATDMLRAGARLAEVGQVLRHRSQLSTSVYAKVDENALRVLARQWPGGGAA